MSKKFAVILSGCGRMDGSEIYETTTSLLAITQKGCSYQCFAPNILQTQNKNHKTGDDDISGSRNVLVESARLARGDVKDIKELDLKDFDVLLFPGGMGAVLNWCDYAEKGRNCIINTEIEKAIINAHKNNITIAAMCIAPVVIAKVLGTEFVKVTIGNDSETADNINSFGAKHVDTKKTDVCIDIENRVVTTPAYMLCNNIAEVYEGAVNLVDVAINL